MLGFSHGHLVSISTHPNEVGKVSAPSTASTAVACSMCEGHHCSFGSIREHLQFCAKSTLTNPIPSFKLYAYTELVCVRVFVYHHTNVSSN